MRKKLLYVVAIILIAMLGLISLSACVPLQYLGDGWRQDFDTELPTFDENDGWRNVMDDNFSDYSSLEEVYANTAWRPVSHSKRGTEYWCDEMVTFDSADGAIVIKSEKSDNHGCDICESNSGIFTSGIETVSHTGEEQEIIFEQAYGYFETTVRVPDAAGMWSAFWLQTAGTGMIGNDGVDGSEIDIYESSFHQRNRTMTGNCVHWDGYEPRYHRQSGHVTDVGYDLYDGDWHKYALLWTPEKYVFYVDDIAVWATAAGGICTVPAYLRLTVEIRDGAVGPYGQSLGRFENKTDGSTDFAIQSVKVWQNESYEPYIKSQSDYTSQQAEIDKVINRNITIGVVCGVVGLVLIGIGVFLIIRRMKTKKQQTK